MDYPLAFTLRDKHIITEMLRHLRNDQYLTSYDREGMRNMMNPSKKGGNHAIPFRQAIVIGDGGSGKTTMITNLKSLVPGIAYTGPTNASGFAFISALNPSIRSCTEFKDHYPTMHKFLNLTADETNALLSNCFAKHVTDAMEFPDFSTYLEAHKVPFHDMVRLVAGKFRKIHDNALLPEHYRAIKKRLASEGMPTDHRSILGKINDAGKLHLVPPLLRYSWFVFDESGRFPVMYTLFFVFAHSWFRHEYGADDDGKAKIINLGSVTQCDVIVDDDIESFHARFSPLTVINKRWWLPEKDVYVKMFKLNRRRLEGNLNKTLLLSMFVEQLESGEHIDPELAENFQKEFCVPASEFTNVERFKGYIFMASRHNDLHTVRGIIEKQNEEKMRIFREYIFADLPLETSPLYYPTSELSRKIQSKFKSVYLDDSFKFAKHLRHYNRFEDREESVYCNRRKLIVDQLVALTHIHKVELEKVTGSALDVARMITFLTPIIKMSERCTRFFSRVMVNAMENPSDICDTLDDFVACHASEEQELMRNKRKRGGEVNALLLQQYDLLHQKLQSEIEDDVGIERTGKRSVYVLAPPGVELVFDANKYEFIVRDYQECVPTSRLVKAIKTNVDTKSALRLRYKNCLDVTMYRKRVRIHLPTGRKQKSEEIVCDDNDEYVYALTEVQRDKPIPEPSVTKRYNGTVFVFPVTPVNIVTVAYAQGQSIDHPMVVRINKRQDAHSVITALTRSEYPDTLTVAADDLTSIVPIDTATVELVKYIENRQTELI